MKTCLNILILLLIFYSCVEPYPLDDQSYKDLLVVDAQLKSDLDYQTITLTRTYPIGSGVVPTETGATIWIEEDNSIINFQEQQPGTYHSQIPFSPQPNRNYSLHIVLSNGNSYHSTSAVSMLNTPPVDRLLWEYVHEREGIVIYIEASDSPDSSPYFLWEYEETYEFNVPFASQYEWVGVNNVISRPVPSTIRTCWNNKLSHDIVIGSSDAMNNNKIIKFPLVIKPHDAEELRTRYSILVKQYKIDNDYHAYLESIKRSTQSSGSLSDPIPGNIPGNIKGSNGETAVGYFTVLHAQTARLYITSQETYEAGYPLVVFPYYCTPDFLTIAEVNTLFASEGNRIHFQIFSIDYETGTFWVMPTYCTDCTFTYSNVKPDFWP